MKFSSFWWFEPPDLSWRGVPICLGGFLNEWNFFPAHEVGEDSCLCHLWAVALTIVPSARDLCFGLVNHPLSLSCGALLPPSSPGNNGVHGSAVSANTPSIMTLYRAVLSALTQHVMCWCYDGPFKHALASHRNIIQSIPHILIHNFNLLTFPHLVCVCGGGLSQTFIFTNHFGPHSSSVLILLQLPEFWDFSDRISWQLFQRFVIGM